MSAPNGVFAPSRIAAVRGLAIPRQVFVFRCQTALIADLLPAPPAGVTSVVKNKRLACNPFVEAVHSVIDTPRIPAPAPGVAMWVSAFSSTHIDHGGKRDHRRQCPRRPPSTMIQASNAASDVLL
jgi:hypothetical protein